MIGGMTYHVPSGYMAGSCLAYFIRKMIEEKS